MSYDVKRMVLWLGMALSKITLYCSNRAEEEIQEDEDIDKLKKKCEVWWGLSDSSTNLAKELLPSEFVTLSPSKEMSFLGDKVSSAAPQTSSLSTPTVTADTTIKSALSTQSSEMDTMQLQTVREFTRNCYCPPPTSVRTS